MGMKGLDIYETVRDLCHGCEEQAKMGSEFWAQNLVEGGENGFMLWESRGG